VVEPEDSLMASAPAAPSRRPPPARCSRHTELGPARSSRRGLSIAADICIYTNHNLVIEELDYCDA
jgi:ATP-dependent HslUV protease subunit HslV